MSFDKHGRYPFPPKPQRYPVQDAFKPVPPPPEDCNRMYSGNRPIAYLDDLKILHNEVLHWLMGPENDFGRSGYVPLLPDGTIDLSFIKDEVVGIDIFNNLENIGYNVKTIEFRGSLVKVVKEDSGKVVIYMHDPYSSRLGTKTSRNDGCLYLTKQSEQQCVQAICPIGPDSEYFGLQPGELVKAFRPTDSLHVIQFESRELICFPNKETHFEVTILNAKGQKVSIINSAVVNSNSTNVIYTDNGYCGLEISEFDREHGNYHAKIKLKIKLKDFFNTSTKFNIVLSHIYDNHNKAIWTSEDMFYLKGQYVDANNIDMSAKIFINSNDATPKLEKIYGITYVKDGSITFTATGINNLNRPLIAKTKIKFETNVSDEEYVFSEDDIDYGEFINIDSNAENCTWSHTFKIKQNFLYPKEKVTAKLTVINAYGEVEKVWEDVRIKYLNETAYINTKSSEYKTNKTTEGFTGQRYIVSDLNYIDTFPRTFNNLNQLLESQYLQVIKGVGLVWPNYFGQRATNTQIKYYNCIFTGDDTNTSKVWGGTFIFGNLTLEQFNKGDFNIRISLNDTTTWYDLNSLKDGEDVREFDDYFQQRDKIKGILCSAEQVDGELIVRYAFPQNICYNHDDVICFKLAMKSTSLANITYIKLRNEDNTKDY